MPKTIQIALLALLLSGCTPMVTSHGNMVPDTALHDIQPVTSSRADVESKWGPPTAVSSFDPNVWYYIGETDSREGIFAPSVDKREMVKVTFNGDDTVKEVAMIDPKEGKDVSIVSRETPSAGKEYTVFQQFVGNIGKFNGAGDKGATGAAAPN